MSFKLIISGFDFGREVVLRETFLYFNYGQTPESGIPPNISPKTVTPKIHLPIWVSSATLIDQLATVTIFGAGVRWSIAFWLLILTVTAFWRDF